MIHSQIKNTFTNPILAGFYPDPAICKAGDDFYLVTSTFAYYPGLPVLHSRDLVHWTTIGHVLDRSEQLDLDGVGVSRGLYAPSIQFHDGVFYVACTLVDKGGNFVVTSRDPKGPWSLPIWLPQLSGIDPSLFFDDDKVYIVYNSDPPERCSQYEGHRTIRMYELDAETLQVKGAETILVNGGVDIQAKPIWIEAPHLYKVGEYYYLMCAEGGTGYDHSEVIFRSKNVAGPYQPGPRNPILTQRHLDPSRQNPITTAGHADLVEVSPGEWWAVFLACRPYSRADHDLYNTGRETFLAPVKWIDGWPVINPDHDEVQFHYLAPLPLQKPGHYFPLAGNFSWQDDFFASSLDRHWVFLRTVRDRWYDLATRKGALAMKVRPETCTDPVNPSFIGHRQQHINSEMIVALDFHAVSENEKAGLVVFQSEFSFLYIAKSILGSSPVVQVFKSPAAEGQPMELLATEPLEQERGLLSLKIESKGGLYDFCFSYNNKAWNPILKEVDGTFLSTRTAGGFVGCVYAMYATSLGKASSNIAYFEWARYSGRDQALD